MNERRGGSGMNDDGELWLGEREEWRGGNRA
jgi:hypothetical protein